MNKSTEKLLVNSEQAACIVLGLNSMTSMGVMRSLACHGVPVIAVTSRKMSIGFFSNKYDSIELVDNHKDTKNLLLEMGSLARCKPVFLCENDEYLLFLEDNKDEFRRYFQWFSPSKHSLAELINKKSMLKIAQDAGLDVPITFFSDAHSLEMIQAKAVFPCLIKPPYTQNEYKTKCEIAGNIEQLLETIKTNRFKSGFLVQEIITGPVSNLVFYIGYFNKNAEPLAGLTGYKIRQLPKDFGIGTVAVSQQNTELKKIAEKFLKDIGFYGLIDVEFKYDERDKKYKFIEINTRPCGLTELASSSGLNLSYLAYCDITGTPFRNQFQVKDGIMWISILDDLITGLKYYIKDDKLILFDWMKKVFTANSYAIFSIKDIKPFFFRVYEMISSFITKR